jgi:hypothetical protein
MKLKRTFFTAAFILLMIYAATAFSAQIDAWKTDWEKTLQAAKKEGQLVLYGSADFENLFAKFNKK